MIKITDIAELAGVSPSTVSNVLNGRKNVGEATRQHVLEVCKEHDYIPNESGRALKKGQSRTVLFYFSDFDRNFYLSIIHGISDYVYSKDYDLLICTNRNRDKYMTKTISCGCIMLDLSPSNNMIAKKAQQNYPIVVMDRLLEAPNVQSLLVNNYDPMKEMVETLIQKGCRRFAYLGGLDSLDNRERLQAVQDALKEHNLHIRRTDYYSGDYREKSGYQAAKLLMLTEQLPDVLICANDDMALGAMKAFKKNGIRIPEDISITGFDDTDIASAMGLTTIHIPNYERGYLAAQYLIDNVEGTGDCDPFKISAKIKWRKSTI